MSDSQDEEVYLAPCQKGLSPEAIASFLRTADILFDSLTQISSLPYEDTYFAHMFTTREGALPLVNGLPPMAALTFGKPGITMFFKREMATTQSEWLPFTTESQLHGFHPYAISFSASASASISALVCISVTLSSRPLSTASLTSSPPMIPRSQSLPLIADGG